VIIYSRYIWIAWRYDVVQVHEKLFLSYHNVYRCFWVLTVRTVWKFECMIIIKVVNYEFYWNEICLDLTLTRLESVDKPLYLVSRLPEPYWLSLCVCMSEIREKTALFLAFAFRKKMLRDVSLCAVMLQICRRGTSSRCVARYLLSTLLRCLSFRNLGEEK
jgi:hypothetical protein